MRHRGRSFRSANTKSAAATSWQIAFAALATLGWLLSATALSSEPNDALTIVWRLHPGDQLRMRMTQRIRTEMRIGEKQSEVSMLTAMELQWSVVRTVPQTPGPGDAIQIEQSFKRLILQVTQADGKTSNYDSESPDPAPKPLEEIAATVRPLLKSRIEIILSPQGEIRAVQMPAETDSLLRGVTAYSRWKNLLTREGIDRMLRQTLGRLPENPVRPGDIWEDIREIETPSGKVSQTNRYEYRGTAVEGGRTLQVVHRTTTARSGEQTGAFDEPPPGREQRDTGILHFDNAAGRLVRSQSRQEIAAEIPWEGGQVRVSSVGTLDTVIEAIESPKPPG
jgi:hypothetical protein